MTDMTHDFSPALPAGYVTAAQAPVNTSWNYAVKGWLLRGETSILAGPSNSGKSALVGVLANAIVSGLPFAGCRTRQGLVVHVAAEAPGSVLDRTLAFADEIDPTARMRYVVRETGIDLSCREQVGDFIGELEAIAELTGEQVALVIFDTLILSIGTQDENSSAGMTLVVEGAKRIARRAGAHVMLVHHTGKAEDRGIRGS
jgi:RecA-family ATPase